MTMRSSMTLLGSIAALTLGACASTGPTDGDAQGPYLNYDDCFFANTMTDWRPLDNMNLVVFTGIRRAYHVQLAMRSMNLRFEDTIAFTDRDGRICPFGGDSIVVNGAIRDRIPIASVRRLTEGEELYMSFGVTQPEVIEEAEPPAEAN
jgi:hypothetical protein